MKYHHQRWYLSPVRTGKYNPTGDKSDDDLPLWEALTHSQKSASLRVLELVRRKTSLEEYQDWGKQLGLTRTLKGNPAEALGGDHTLLEMTRVFGTFARRGHRPDNHFVRKVVAGNGRVLERHISPVDPYSEASDAMISLWDSILKRRSEPLEETTAYLTTANLLEVVQRGTGKRAKKLEHLVAGKTGTLDYDVWFAGFTWARTAVTWLGSDRYERPQASSVSGMLGGTIALSMARLHERTRCGETSADFQWWTAPKTRIGLYRPRHRSVG